MRKATRKKRFKKNRIILFILAAALVMAGIPAYAQEAAQPPAGQVVAVSDEPEAAQTEEQPQESEVQPSPTPAEQEKEEQLPEATTEPESTVPEATDKPEALQPEEADAAAEELAIMPLSIVTSGLDPNEVMVDNFADLKTVLTDYSTYAGVDTIYLNGDIVYQAGGIQINTSRTAVTIVGHPKGDTSTIYTITDIAGGSAANTIRIVKNDFSLTVKDVNINGKNYYGPFMVYDGYTSCTLSYENVTYTGPQMTYNWRGLTRYVDCTVTITQNGGDPPQEVGEVSQVEIGGVTTFSKAVGDTAMFWFRGNSGSNQYLKVFDGANVTASHTSTLTTVYGFIYVEGAGAAANQKPVVTIGTGASLFVTARNGFTSYDHRVESVTLNEGAALYIDQTAAGAGYPTIGINTLLQVDEGAVLDVQRSTNTTLNGLIRFYTSGAQMQLNNPARVKLYNPNTVYKRVVSVFQGTATISGTVGSINAWTTDSGLTDSIANMPANIWNKNDSSVMNLSVTMSTSAVTAASISNYDSGTDPFTSPFNSTNFDTYNMPIMVMGSYYLDTDDIYPQDTQIIGTAVSAADVRVSYTNNSVAQTLNTTADGSGIYAVNVPDSPIAQGTEVIAMSHKNYLKARHITSVLAQPSVLRFYNVPAELAFLTGQVSALPQTVGRQDAGWTMSVEDTRGAGSSFRIDASIAQPLSGTNGGTTYTLPGALVYVDGSGTSHALGSVPMTIYNGVTGSTPQTNISWAANRGILVSLDGGQGVPNVAYGTTIEWSLIDAP
ncbi:MAG: pectate lyase-like adhesive domain-containing protein [Christensenella sp.]|uniref:pectate lyase-like adhesive domain-containing protein n=1 Tax=Christensenella sp. TaxID=1935934 RepID=UPI002B218586|nr:pectate lyase-like adhesive domain-containing protein [Christensenella sp.]MEA5001903.1 pectate lyase-like adhesive domain-containing protein [Christensenella sp.]